MIDRKYIKCNYCGTTIMMRFQVGYFDIPFDICCPKCKARINGVYGIRKNNSFDITGADDVKLNLGKADYFADFSVELPHCKLTKFNSSDSLFEKGFSPFMMTVRLFDDDDYFKYIDRINKFNYLKNTLFHRILEMYSIFFEDNIEYIKFPLFKISDAFVIENSLDASMALHQLLVLFLNKILPDKSLKEFMDCCNSIMEMMCKDSYYSVLHFITQLGGKEYINKETKKVLDIITEFCNMFEALIPVIILSLSDVRDNIDKDCYGISTVSFSNLKTFYANSYELL